MELPQSDDADTAVVFTAAISTLFKTHPDPEALLRAWEPIAASMPLMVLKNGAVDVAHDANVVIAQGLLQIARMGVRDSSSGDVP